MFDDSTLRQAVNDAGGFRPAARMLRQRGIDISESNLRRRLGLLNKLNPFSVELPGGRQAESIRVDELIERRIQEFRQKRQVHERERLIPVRVHLDGPIGLGFQGDPHLDDSGTDLEEVFDHVNLFDERNEGLYAAGLGDVTNNWVGRLSHLWSKQSIDANETRLLATEYLSRINWLFYIFGNHDCWQDGQSILSMILDQNAAIKKDTKVRVALRLPNGRNVRIYAVHGFAGKSMWSQVYGAAKKAQLDGEHHDVYVGAHTHVSGYTHGMRPSSRKIWHAVQVASYKKIDRYAEELGLDEHDMYNCPVALIDPHARSEINFIRFEFDPYEAAERLRWMRSRWSAGKSSS